MKKTAFERWFNMYPYDLLTSIKQRSTGYYRNLLQADQGNFDKYRFLDNVNMTGQWRLARPFLEKERLSNNVAYYKQKLDLLDRNPNAFDFDQLKEISDIYGLKLLRYSECCSLFPKDAYHYISELKVDINEPLVLIDSNSTAMRTFGMIFNGLEYNVYSLIYKWGETVPKTKILTSKRALQLYGLLTVVAFLLFAMIVLGRSLYIID